MMEKKEQENKTMQPLSEAESASTSTNNMIRFTAAPPPRL